MIGYFLIFTILGAGIAILYHIRDGEEEDAIILETTRQFRTFKVR